VLKTLLRAFGRRSELVDSAEPWSLSKRLFSFSKKDHLTIGRACEGLLIMGTTGAGKSSASGRTIALSYLRSGFGGLVLTAKADETRVWQQYCRETGRLDDLIIFSPEQPWRFNFLDFELQRKGRGAGLTDNIRHLLSTIADITKQDAAKGGGQSDGQYWEDSKDQLLRNLIDLIILAKGRITVRDLYGVLSSSPKSIEQSRSAEWQKNSYCYQCLREAYLNPKARMKPELFQVLDEYWMGFFAELADKTRGIVASTFTAMTDVLNRGILSELFAGETNITPEAIEDGKIIVIDLPVTEFLEVGRYAAGIWKYCSQMSLKRRDVQANPRPVFLWQDEADNFVLSSDTKFQSVCRSYKVSNVLLSQNISNFYATMGGEKSEALVDSLFGNLNTRIFHANGDHKTNKWMAEVIGRKRVLVASANTSHDPTDSVSAMFGIGPCRTSSGVSEVFEFEVQPSICTTFRTGGPANRWLVDSIIFSNGSCFHATGRPYLFCTFSQK
jgi:type IV secretory pathway TraG/TraD family ATPase VirD4